MWMIIHLLLVLYQCWFDCQTCSNVISEMTYSLFSIPTAELCY